MAHAPVESVAVACLSGPVPSTGSLVATKQDPSGHRMADAVMIASNVGPNGVRSEAVL